MTKIAAEHLARGAIVYVRQSTMEQVNNNLESQRRQYGLAERAKQLGWERVEVIDEDLGRSGGGIARPGFEKLLAAICEGRVGAVNGHRSFPKSGRLKFPGLAGAGWVSVISRMLDRKEPLMVADRAVSAVAAG